MGRIGDIADLVTGLALLGGGYLIYRAVKDVGDIVPDVPSFTWPTLPDWTMPTIPGIGGDEGIGGGGGGVRNGDTNGFIAPPYVPDLPGAAPPSDAYIKAVVKFGLLDVDLTKGLGRIYEISDDLFGFRKAPGLEFGTRREARKYLKVQEWIL